MASLNCYLLPELFQDEQLEGATAVVIDVLRATTTIAAALARGATRVVACCEVDEARREADRFPKEQRLLGGERGCVAIDGFDLGNSPSQYRPQAVAGKTIVFTTTNGTRAMLRCRAASRVLLGAFVNLSALCRAIAGQQHIALVCAGTGGEIAFEDALLAGAIVDRLLNQMGREFEINDQAALTGEAYRATLGIDRPVELATLLSTSRGGRNLTAVGMDEDIAAAAQVDHWPVVPQFDMATRHIRLM